MFEGSIWDIPFENRFVFAAFFNGVFTCTQMFTYFNPHSDPSLTKEKNLKMDELKMHCAKGCYYLTVAFAEVSALQGYPWMPKILGGQGIINSPLPANRFPNYPRVSDTDMLWKIFVLQLFYHGMNTIFSVIPGNRIKPEMFLHHTVTMVLMAAAIYTDQVLQGCIVLLLHDAPDVLVCTVKFFHVLNLTYPTLLSFVAMLSAWAYFRLYLFARYAAGIFFNSEGIPSNRINGLLLFTLVGLHLWWFYLFLKMGYKFATGGGSLPKDETQKMIAGGLTPGVTPSTSPRGETNTSSGSLGEVQGDNKPRTRKTVEKLDCDNNIKHHT